MRFHKIFFSVKKLITFEIVIALLVTAFAFLFLFIL